MTPVCCQNCGHLIDARRTDGVVERFGLVVCIDPPVAFYRHRLMTKPASPTCVRFLFILARWGEANYDLFYPAMARSDYVPATLHVYVSQTRRWLEENNVDVAIEAVRDWGFKLRQGAAPKSLGNWSSIKRAFAEAGEV